MKDTIEWATIGKIVAPFGIRGEMKVYPFTDIPDRFANLKKIYLGVDGSSYPIKSVRPYKGDLFVLKLDGINDATFVEGLRDCELRIPVSEMAQLPSGSYYQHDIIGLRVLTLADHEVGIIIEIMSTGSNDVYVIKASDGKQILIPAIKDVVKQIDLIRHVMYIDPMQGLLDEDEAEEVDPPTEEEAE